MCGVGCSGKVAGRDLFHFFPFWFLRIQWLMIWGDELVEEGEVTSELGGGEMEIDDYGGEEVSE